MAHGELIRRARENRGWTITKLSSVAGIDRPMVSRIERGQLAGSLETVLALAIALDIDLNLLKTEPEVPFEDAPTVT